jgi:hypothetical protein
MKLICKIFIFINFFIYSSLFSQIGWINKCDISVLREKYNKLKDIQFKDSLFNNERRQIVRTMDSSEDLTYNTWWEDRIWYRDTAFHTYANQIIKDYCLKNKLDRYYVYTNMLYTPPQLEKSRIANLPENDSMTIYYFTWYTIKADWEAASAKGFMSSFSFTKENDADANGDLPDGLWKWYDSMGYNRVYMLRKLILKRTPCKWIIHASKDHFFTPDNLHPAIDSFNLMMQDGKERFTFEYENTYAACMTRELLTEWNYPLDFYYPSKRKAHVVVGGRYLNNWIWQYGKIELKDKPAKKAVIYHKGKNKANRNYLTNNMLVTFSDGTHKSLYLPFWFYIHKNYIRKWTPPQQ